MNNYTEQQRAIMLAARMAEFADGEKVFNYNDWKAWEVACAKESRNIPPSEFKAMPKHERSGSE